MGDNIPSEPKKFNTGLTGYSISSNDKTGPYSDNLEIDALVVGAGFGTKKYQLPILVFPDANYLCSLFSRYLYAQVSSGSWPEDSYI